ncbi:MAG: flavodoxin family protein [Candidatus Lokiarchaeota archaeon]|nr:flavodoxin family protein [Candidatus Lokiarchaeota archaeon]
MKVLIVYETKYGNTKKAAETMGDVIKEAGNDVTVMKVDVVESERIKDYEALVIGSPTYASSQAKSIKKFISSLDVDAGTKIVVFDTHSGDGINTGGPMRRAVKKMEKQIEKNPNLEKIMNGLQVAVKGIEGPLIDGELEKCKAFAKKIVENL